ncbi:hypothetical protein ACEQ8H_006421 [Pleosporales sp. CAS-2024a]
MSPSPSNSIDSGRRASRAGSRQAGQSVQDPGEFDFDSNWDFEGAGLDDFGIAPQMVNALQNNPQPLQQPYYPYLDMQQQQQQPFFAPQFDGSSAVDPTLLMPQYAPQYLQSTELQATPGLTALPGLTSNDMPYPAVNSLPMYAAPIMQSGHAYQDPSVLQQSQPYYAMPAYVQNSLQHPVQQPTAEVLGCVKRRRSESISGLGMMPPTKRVRAASAQSDSGSDSESDSEQVAKFARTSKRRCGRRVSSGVSSSGDSLVGNQDPATVGKRTGQLPERDPSRSWVRTNTSTRGETTRTDRINREARLNKGYVHHPLPNGNWQTPNKKYTFEYKHNELHGMDELQANDMSPRQIMAYIMKYPSEHLKLWIQYTPADSARRYGSKDHSRCLFTNCPKRVYGKNGNIDTGHFRVAFDEKFLTVKKHPNKVIDPFDCTGFVHLTCLERFCDFEVICREANVEVDLRGEFPKEPGGKARFSMLGSPGAAIAKFFVKACRKGRLRASNLFKDYPVHLTSSEAKPFDHTLTKAMYEAKFTAANKSQKKQFCLRNLTPSQLIINLGDLEVSTVPEKIKASRAFRADCASLHLKPNQVNMEPYYAGYYGGVINKRIAECLNSRSEFEAAQADKEAGIVPNQGKGNAAPRTRKRKAEGLEYDSGTETHDEYYEAGGALESPRDTNRTSPRKRQRPNYAVDGDDVLTPSPSAPAPAPAPWQFPQPFSDPGYQPAEHPRQESFSHLFAQNGNTFDMDNWQPGPDGEYVPMGHKNSRLNSVDYFSMLDGLTRRRKSSTLSNLHLLLPQATSIIKSISQRGSSAHSPRKPSDGRQASFATQPISQTKEFDINDPPAQVASTTPTRRSTRLASRDR